MNRDKYTLAVLSALDNTNYTPVQIQKLFFLLDKNLGNILGGPHFNFEPYHYGPFDKNVYRVLDSLRLSNLITTEFETNSNVKVYQLTMKGKQQGKLTFDTFNETERNYIQDICSFVKSLSFEELIKAVYKAYPEMKVNSLFRSDH